MTRLLLASVLCVASAALATAPDAGVALRYLALGDSFTVGTGELPGTSFPTQLARRLRQQGLEVRLENPAVNGFSTNELIAKELPALESFRPDTVTLAIGANDVVRGNDLERYRANLKRIFAALAKARVAPTRTFVLPQPDWASSPAAEGLGEPEVLRAQIEAANRVLAEEAKAAGAVYVDLWPLFLEQAKAKLLAPDGLHPSAKAYAAWAEALAPLLAGRGRRDASLRP